MEALNRTTTIHGHRLLHSHKPLRCTPYNRIFAAIYSAAVLTLLFRHTQTLLHSPTFISVAISVSLLISDLILSFMWLTTQSFRLRPIRRQEFPENLATFISKTDFPALDVFICTADPYKEPPMNVVNTALSVMAYDYPPEKISVYVSDDGGSDFTLFAFMEAAKFAGYWLPFCRRNNLPERSPDNYFGSQHVFSSESENIKMMYETMKFKVEHVLERGKVGHDYISTQEDQEVFNKWTRAFTRHDHPTVIQVLLDNSKDKDTTSEVMPNLIYVAREKSKHSPHHFKAGALNALLRVSATMTNAPMVLTLDCDMYSNDPQTPLRVLCYVQDPECASNLGYVQFPQRFHGLNKDDIYAGEFKYLFQINPLGMDGLAGPNYVGSGCFFLRRVFFGPPSSPILPEIAELGSDHVVKQPIQSKPVLALAHNVASSNYEINTKWGSKIGFRYGSLVEDFYTGYRMQCEGWMAIFCNPEKAAFYGDVPINLIDVINQTKRWAIGLLEVVFCKYNPLIFNASAVNALMRVNYTHYSFWPTWCIPVTTYAFLPQLALLNKVSIFPKVSEPGFLLYVFLFVAAYGQDLVLFILAGGTIRRWWNEQRMWLIRSISAFLFASVEFCLKSLGISTFGFNVTSKVLDNVQSKRYEQGTFEFGVASTMFVPITMAAIINFVAFICGLIHVLRGGDVQGLVMQMCIAGFGVLNCWPVYEAMALRSDRGRIPIKTTTISSIFAFALCTAAALILRN